MIQTSISVSGSTIADAVFMDRVVDAIHCLARGEISYRIHNMTIIARISGVAKCLPGQRVVPPLKPLDAVEGLDSLRLSVGAPERGSLSLRNRVWLNSWASDSQIVLSLWTTMVGIKTIFLFLRGYVVKKCILHDLPNWSSKRCQTKYFLISWGEHGAFVLRICDIKRS